MNRFFLTLNTEFHPEKGREDTCFHGHLKANEILPSVLSGVSHVETAWSYLWPDPCYDSDLANF